MILITGASGTVGAELLRQLRAKGAEARGAFHSRQKAERAKTEGVESTVLDFADRQSIAAALEGTTKLFLLGATAPNQPELEGNVVEEAIRAGTKHIVKLSVLDAAREKYTFAKWHRAVEKKIEKSGVTYTFLRPNGFMQNFVNYYGDTIRNQSAFYLPAKDSKCSVIDVRDIAAVAARTLTEAGHEGGIYELTGPEALTNQQIAEKLSRAIGRRVNYVDIPPAGFKQALLTAGIPEFYADALVDLEQAYVSGAGAQVTSEVERITGKRARTFDDFAEESAKALALAA